MLSMIPDDFVKVAMASAAVAHAEGFWVPGALPRRNNNPGDLLDHTGDKDRFSTRTVGWNQLLNQWALMLGGRSHVYHLNMTWRRVALLWTGGDNAAAWCASVCDDLGVEPDSTLGEFAGVTPAPQTAQAPSAPAPASPAQ